MASNARKILLPYQQRYVNDRSSLKIWLASRQIGKSFSIAMEAVTEALEQKCNNLILSSSERQSKEVMQKVFSHLRFLKIRSNELIKAERETREEITLPNGSRIISLPANPGTVRGFSGNVFLDEFAFHKDSREIWKAMYPTVTRGYKVRITSTPNGKQNMFYELWQHNTQFSKHKTDIHLAVKEGLKVDINDLRAGITDPDSWAQEFECQFVDEATAYITYDMITACESDTCCARSSLAGETVSRLAGWGDGEMMYPFQGDLYGGTDIGRKHDLTVVWLLEKLGDVFYTRLVKYLSKEKFRVQQDYLELLISSIKPKLRRFCIDSTGLGMQLAESLHDKFGTIVEPVTFTLASKEEMAVTLRRRFEDRQMRIPVDRVIREDIHSIKKLSTAAGNIRYDAERSEGSHADRFWALALAVHAGSTSGAPAACAGVDSEFDWREKRHGSIAGIFSNRRGGTRSARTREMAYVAV